MVAAFIDVNANPPGRPIVLVPEMGDTSGVTIGDVLHLHRRRPSLEERRRRAWLDLIDHACELQAQGAQEPDRRLLILTRNALRLEEKMARHRAA